MRQEYYEVVDKLKSCFHMSQNQAEAAVVVTANKIGNITMKELKLM